MHIINNRSVHIKCVITKEKRNYHEQLENKKNQNYKREKTIKKMNLIIKGAGEDLRSAV